MTRYARPIRIAAALAALAVLPACGMFDGEDPRPMIVVPPPPPPPQPMMAPQAAPPMSQAPAPMAPAPMQAPPAQAIGPALAGHLASYRNAESAQAGWQQLVRAQPALQTLKPYFVPVTINGQPWVRLLAGDFPNAAEVNRFCNWARANRMYCMPMPVAGAAQPSAAMPQGTPAAPAAQRQRQPRGTPQPAPAMAPAAPAAPAPAAPTMAPGMAPAAPPAAAPAPAPAPQSSAPAPAAQPAANQPPQPLAPPLPARRQPAQPGIPQ